jgi:hypothetical protein
MWVEAGMEEEPRTTDTGPASTSETRETRIETAEVRTSSDVRTSTPAKDEGVRDQGEEAEDDQRDRGDAPKGSSLGSKLGSKLGLGHHGDQADRDETE